MQLAMRHRLKSFDIVVLSDLVAPVLTAPANITLEAEGPEGITDTDVASEAVATFLAAAAALDDIDGDISSSITNDLAYPVCAGRHHGDVRGLGCLWKHLDGDRDHYSCRYNAARNHGHTHRNLYCD